MGITIASGWSSVNKECTPLKHELSPDADGAQFVLQHKCF